MFINTIHVYLFIVLNRMKHAFFYFIIASVCLLMVIGSSCRSKREVVAKTNGLSSFNTLKGTPATQLIRNRNVLHLSIGTDSIFCNNEAIGTDEIKPMVKQFFLNPDNDTLLSDKAEIDIQGLGLTEVSKGLVLVTNMRETPYGLYLTVQNEIIAAINELRDDFSRKTFGLPFEELNDEARKAVAEKFPMEISEPEPE